eukprot:9505428-Alexandrium_andersonii.AAC.1
MLLRFQTSPARRTKGACKHASSSFFGLARKGALLFLRCASFVAHAGADSLSRWSRRGRVAVCGVSNWC